MKKLIFLLIMLMAVPIGAETSKYGSMWKQNDKTVSPADDVVYVDFTGYTTIGVGGGDGIFLNLTGGTLTGPLIGEGVMFAGVFGVGLGVPATGAGTRCFWYPKKAAWRCGDVDGTQWDEASIGVYSWAGGHDTIASGISSHSEGWANIASGVGSHAEGDHSVASSSASHAEGYYTDATGALGAHSEGQTTLASGSRSHAEGSSTTASGIASHSEGVSTLASGDYSHSGGNNTIAGAAQSFARGTFVNISSSASGSVIFGNYSNAAERDANKLTTPDTFKIANLGLSIEAEITVYDNYSVIPGIYTVFAHATSSAKNLYLPDATTVGGMHLRLKKKDTSDNHITINAVGGQNIDGNGFKVLEQTNNAIMLYSNGSNWEVLQATSVAHYGEMHVHDNSTATTIDTANVPHLMQGLFAEEDTEGFSFVAGSAGVIASFADYSATVVGAVKVADVDHGLSSGAILSITGTDDYNEVYEATVIDSANYYVFDGYSGTDTGNWYEGDMLLNDTGKTAKHVIEFHGFGAPETNNDILSFHLYKDVVLMENLESKGKFTSNTDVKPVSASGLVTLADGEGITFAITNTSGTGDFTMEHINVVIHSF